MLRRGVDFEGKGPICAKGAWCCYNNAAPEVYARGHVNEEARARSGDVDRGYVKGLAAKEPAKEPEDPSKVNWPWNWPCGTVTKTNLGWRCAIKHV